MSTVEPTPLASLVQPLSPFVLHARRGAGEVVGRPAELAAIQQELAVAKGGRFSALTVEGEPGIGKTRLLLSAADSASAQGFTTVVAAADEEIRGPFLLARSILGSPAAQEAATGTPAAESLSRGLDVLSGHDDPALASMPADQKLLRAFDLGAVALRSLAAERPLALLVDDLQWADDDSLRLLRYLVRAGSASPIFLMASIRPEEMATLTEAVNLVADMERLGLIRRLVLNRFSPVETAELLQQTIAGKVDPVAAATVHRQAEGVPFIVEEIARAYREAGMLQLIDGTWTLAPKADRLVPSAVRTLISRRAAHLPDETRASLAEAAVLGRRFSLKDLREVQLRVRPEDAIPASLEDDLAPAVSAGLLVQHPEASAADYSFAHEQVREFAASSLSASAKRAVHAAIVELLLAGEPSAESLPLLAQHAREAGDSSVCVKFALQATANALSANAPEEVLRVVELSLPAASTPQERVGLLQARDQALEMLRRARDRLEGLAELAALADALGDRDLAFEVQLRRAAALRVAGECDAAATLARRVRDQAEDAGDQPTELAAALELGQDLLRSTLGESFSPPPYETDLEGAEEAFQRAAELAGSLGDDVRLAAALRELAVIDLSRLREWFVERVKAGEHLEYLRRITLGETFDELIEELPIAPVVERIRDRLERALALFEAAGDRRGAMSSVIALAYLNWGPDIHLGSGAGRHIEEIRRLSDRMQAFTKESDRARAEGQMLYGAHVFARAKVVPDLAVARGEDAYRHSRVVGDRTLEFLAAGGTAMALIALGSVEEAGPWLDRAAAVATESPTPFRARQLEAWRGACAAAAGDADAMRRHLEREVALATEQGLPAARCEALARLALAAARLGGDEELLALAEASANEVLATLDLLPGRPPWRGQAHTALALVARARGLDDRAIEEARASMMLLMEEQHEDLDFEAIAATGRIAVDLGTTEEQGLVRYVLGLLVGTVAMRTMDEEVRARWFRSPIGRELSDLVGSMEGLATPRTERAGVVLDDDGVGLLSLVVQGRTNGEIAAELGVGEDEVRRRLSEVFARVGASSRAEATALAFRSGVV